MSEYAPEVEVTQDQPVEVGTGGGNPWDSYLTDLPQTVRPLVEPLFKQWDADTTKRFQSVHSEYEPLKQYQEFQQQGWTAEDLTQAVQVMAALNSDPESVYNALVENFGYGATEQGQEDTDLSYDGEEPQYADPRFAQLEQQQQLINDFLLQQEQTKQEAQEDQQLDQYLSSLQQNLGEFDMDYVLTKMYSGMSGEDAVAQYQQLTAGQNRPNVPVIMGSGGGLPSQTVNPGTMNDKDRKNLVMQLLAQANQQ